MKSLKLLIGYAAPHKKYVLTATIMSVFSVILTMITPVIIGRAIDAMVYGQTDYQYILSRVIILLTMYLTSALLNYLAAGSIIRLSEHTVKGIRADIFNKVQKLPMSYLDGKSKGDIISRMINDLEQVSKGIIQGYRELITGIVTIITVLIIMFSINAYIALTVITVSSLSIFIAYTVARRAEKLFTLQHTAMGELSVIAKEVIENQELVRTYNYDSASRQRFKELNIKHRDATKLAHFNSSLTNPTTRFVNHLVYISVGMLGVLLKVSVGDISSLLIYANQFTRPINDVTTIITELQSAIAALNRVNEFLSIEELDDSGMDELTSIKGEVGFNNVTFGYNDKMLINDLNLNIKPGEKAAIVGSTGAGKTTLVNLLIRFYELNKGYITIDNKDIKSVSLSSLRECIGMVLQRNWIFNGTIADNISYGKPDATIEEIIDAAKRAECHEFIIKFKKGYNTMLTGSGRNLSAGEQQLIALSRVMLAAPEILILDEATSSVDIITEYRIRQAFDRLMENSTTFIIAHRLSTIVNADVIMMMEDGDIIEQGTHQELIDRRGAYYRLYESQYADSI